MYFAVNAPKWFLTQRSTGFALKLAFAVGFINGNQKCWHLLPKSTQAIGPAALQPLQVF